MIEKLLSYRPARFALVGGFATLVHACVLALLVELGGVRPTFANLAAFLTALSVSYFGHRGFTFRSDAPHHRAAPGFLFAALAGLGVNLILFLVLTDVFSVHYAIVFALVTLLAPCVVYVIARDHAFKEPRQKASSAQSIVSLKILAVPALAFLGVLIYTLLYYYPVFYFDHWDLMPMAEAAGRETLEPGRVFRLHGFHWHASGYVLMLALGTFTGFSHLAEVLTSLGLAVLAFWGLTRLMRRQVRAFARDVSLFWPLAFAGVFLFSLDQSQNWLWGWQVAVFANLVGVIWCIEALTRARHSLQNSVLACSAAAFAIYGFATGWALLPIGLGLLGMQGAWRTRSGRVALVLWTLLSAGLLWHLTLALTGPGEALAGEVSAGGLASPASAYGLYAMNYIASAVTRFSPDIALPVFVISAGIFMCCLIIVYRKNRTFLLKLGPALALMAYAVGAGLLTAFGRLDHVGADTAFLGRYITFSNLYWLGLVALVFAVWPLVGARVRTGLAGYVGLLMLMKLGTIGNVVSSAQPHALEVRAAAGHIRACYPELDKEVLAKLFAPSQMGRAEHNLSYLYANNYSLFSGMLVSGITETETCSQKTDEAPL